MNSVEYVFNVLKIGLERNLKQAVRQTKNDNKDVYFYELQASSNWLINCLSDNTSFIAIPSFSFSSCCIVVTECPAVNMLTALRIAPKSTLVGVAQIYTRAHSQVLTS